MFHRRKTQLILSALQHRAAELGDQAVFTRTATYRQGLELAPDDDISVCAPTTWAARRFTGGVMVPNVVGMALHADGGQMMTKPYTSGAPTSIG